MLIRHGGWPYQYWRLIRKVWQASRSNPINCSLRMLIAQIKMPWFTKLDYSVVVVRVLNVGVPILYFSLSLEKPGLGDASMHLIDKVQQTLSRSTFPLARIRSFLLCPPTLYLC